MKTIRKHLLVFAVLAVSACYLAYQGYTHFRWTEKNSYKDTVFSDGSGYYAYLPATFIYKDFRFQFLKEIRRRYGSYDFVMGLFMDAPKEQVVDKYYVGTSVLMAPFFLGTYGCQYLLYGNPGDGYSRAYQFSVSLSALFYYLLGMLAVFLFLRSYSFSDFTIAFVILALTFGTSLNFYTVYYPSFSHVYSFCVISWFLYSARLFALHPRNKFLYLVFVLAALILLIKPTNILVLLLFPFLFDSPKAFSAAIGGLFQKRKIPLLTGLVLFLLVFSPQIINMYLQIGRFAFNTYTQETFAFLSNPKIPEVLLGYRKGLLTYAPVLFLAIPGLWFLFRKKPSLFAGWLLTFGACTYLIASWWCWWYGGGLGMRPFVELSLLIAIPLAFLVEHSLRIVQPLYVAILLFGCYVYQTYQLQFNKDILHYERMTKETFWQVFLRTEDRNKWFVFFTNDPLPKGEIRRKKSLYYHVESKSWQAAKGSSRYDYGVPGQDLETRHIYVPEQKTTDRLTVRITADILIAKEASSPAFFVICYKDGREIRRRDFYLGSRIQELHTPSSVEITANPGLREDQIDSVGVFFTHNLRPSAFRNLRIDYLNYRAD